MSEDADFLYGAIHGFIQTSRTPVLLEPGEPQIPLQPGNFSLEVRSGRVTLQAWDEQRNISRRVTAISEERAGRLDLIVERFGKRTGTLQLLDLGRPQVQTAVRRASRLTYRETFRHSLSRQFPGWRIAELSTEQDLHHTLSPSYPRALLKKGTSGIAAIGAGPESDPDGLLSFGLIWLHHLRRREPRLKIPSLALFLPLGRERATCLRLLYFDSVVAAYSVFVYSPEGFEDPVDLSDYGNIDTRVQRATEAIRTGHALSTAKYREAFPEFWLEKQIRADIQSIDAGIQSSPVYGQVPAFAATDRGIIDLLAVDILGRLAILELKASQDIHLPLQALDYWIRVKWHLDRNEFSPNGYFPGLALAPKPPRMLLVAPSLDFHPTTETILSYLSPSIDVERKGLGMRWRDKIQVVFHAEGAKRPEFIGDTQS
jgi:hypothetical protein